MVWAEMGGINGRWKTFLSLKENKPIWQGDVVIGGNALSQKLIDTTLRQAQGPENFYFRLHGPLAREA